MECECDLEKFISSLDKEKIIFLIQYGSSLGNENYEDIDLVMIEKEMKGKESMRFAGFDVIVEGMDYFQEKINSRDPAYATEPILTGKLLIGDRAEFNRIKKKLKKETEADWRQLLQFSIEEYYRAERFLDRQLLFESLQVLGFAFSYHHFSKWYLNSDSLISWKRLQNKLSLESKELLAEMNDLFKIAKENEEDLKKETVEQLFNFYAKKFLLSSGILDK